MKNKKELKKIFISILTFVIISLGMSYYMNIKTNALENEKVKVTEKEPKYEGDVLSKNISLNEWKNVLKKYDYVYMYFTDQEFYDRYWKTVTNIDLWNEYVYKYENNDFCLVVDNFKCSK